MKHKITVGIAAILGAIAGAVVGFLILKNPYMGVVMTLLSGYMSAEAMFQLTEDMK